MTTQQYRTTRPASRPAGRSTIMAAIATTHPPSASSLKRFIIRHPVAAFLGLVYGLTWLLFLPSNLSENGIGVLPFEIADTTNH